MNIFHYNHYRLSLRSDADESDNIRVVVLFQYAALLQKLLLCLLRQSLSTCLDCHFRVSWLVDAPKYISKVTLSIKMITTLVK